MTGQDSSGQVRPGQDSEVRAWLEAHTDPNSDPWEAEQWEEQQSEDNSGGEPGVRRYKCQTLQEKFYKIIGYSKDVSHRLYSSHT